MKRNLVLLTLLGGLLWLAWHWEHGNQKVEGIFGKARWEEIVAIEMPSVTLKKVKKKWVVSGTEREADIEKVKAVWEALGMIFTEREITNQNIPQNEAFPQPSERFVIHLSQSRVEIVLGNILQFDQSFYLKTVDIRGGEKSTRQWVARDVSTELGIYNVKTVYRSPAKYQRLKSLLRLKADNFFLKEQS